MSLLNDSVQLFKKSIILCDDKKILKILCYRETILISEIVTNLLTTKINDKNICLGLLMNHNVYLPSIILSIQKLNHAFVFLTSKNLSESIACSKCFWILSFECVKEIPAFHEVDRLRFDNSILILWKRCEFSSNIDFQNIFCLVQTSGSTGQSKLIKVTNTCIDVNASNLRKTFSINSEDVIFWGTNLTFDPSLIELLLALQSGACLIIVPYNVSINPTILYKALFNVINITFLQMVPSVFLRWSDDYIQQILLNSQLRILAFGGELFPQKILSYERAANLRIFNLYGISEVSCWATLHEVTDETQNDDIPIGESLEETVVELRDETGRKVNEGKGEVFIGSSTRVCYINDESPTEICGNVFRRTGDIAELNKKGIFLLGRENKIIKRFGHRINLTRIEKQIFQEMGLENKCIWSQENRKLMTFILIKNLNTEIKGRILDRIHIKLLNILPEDSFPDFVDIITNFPLTSHGKINERALECMYTMTKVSMTCKDIFTLLWCKYIGISPEDLTREYKHYTFFEMGGNSISVLQFLREYKEMITYEYPQELTTMIFESNCEDIMNYIENFKSVRKKDSSNTEATEEHAVKKRKSDKYGLKIVWSYNSKACVDSTPLIFKRSGVTYIVVGSFSHKFMVFYENGEIFYEITLPDSIESTSSISPCQNFILVGCLNGVMYCIDFIKKKQIMWEFSTGSKIKSSACFCRKQSAAVFGSYDKMIYCVSIMEGVKLWNISLDGGVSSNPIYDEDKKCIYTATLKGTCFSLNEEEGQIVWTTNCNGPIFGTPCLVNSNKNIIFPTVTGILYCLQTETGEVLWKYKTNGNIFSSLVSYKNCILFGCHDKTVNVLNISASECTLIKKIMVGSETSTTPFVYNVNGNDIIVTVSNSGLISVVDFGTFELLSDVQLPNEVFSSPCVHNNKVYVGCRDNNFYCIEFNKTS